jgi:putative zinc finger/helix-turn-helix YgiT family protein
MMRSPEPFPWLCGQCGAEKVFPEKIAYETNLRYDGRDYKIVVPDLPALKCRECGAVLLNNESDAHLSSAFREQLKLLQPATIREGRKGLGLNQREFAELLGVAEESVSRWETGAQMQSRVVDKSSASVLPRRRRVSCSMRRGRTPLSARLSSLPRAPAKRSQVTM